MTTPSREGVPVVCPNCNEARTVAKHNTKVPEHTGLCQKCNGLVGNKARREQSANWKGGRIKSGDGYYRVLVEKDSPYYAMANNKGYVLEHRLVMANHIGRCLEKWEVVHHKNEIRNDNRIENLLLLPIIEHIALGRMIKEAKREEQRRMIRILKDASYALDEKTWQALGEK